MSDATESPHQLRTPTAVIFDGDDTLWSTEILYDRARDDARAVVEEAGVDGAEWERLARVIDLANVERFQYSPQRFPTSCVEAYEELCRARGLDARDETILRVREAASSVFNRNPVVDRHAGAVLSELRRRGVQVALLTKGDAMVQRQRVETSGLRALFHIIRIVDRKTPETLAALARELSAPLGNTWMVGNSVRSDILPALEASLRALWLDAHVWEHERTHDHLVDERVQRISSLLDVPAAVLPPPP
jgi:putative hydrolase of the HAD superfamily